MNVSPDHDSGEPKGAYRDLATRASSATALVAITLTLTAISPWTFAALVISGALILAWEWEKLRNDKPGGTIFLIHSASVIIACGTALFGETLYATIALFLGAIIAAATAGSLSNRAWAAGGILYLGLAMIILIALRNDQAFGLWAILFLFLIVWSADSAAYFAGRTFAGPKLAPSISPGKTWSGFLGGLIVPAFLAYLYALLLDFGNPLILALVGIALAIASQAGDLAESAIKRNFGAKDSGTILPGHGGLFDRVDGLIGAAIAAGILVLYRSDSLAPRALLIWH